MNRMRIALIALSTVFLSMFVAEAKGGRSGGRSSHSGGRTASSSRSSSRSARSASRSARSASSVRGTGTTTRGARISTRQGKSYCSSCARDSRGKIKRDREATRAFQKSHPCPSTGGTSGGCPGYIIDHVTALKRGGADAPSNMQWQTRAEAKAKDRVE